MKKDQPFCKAGTVFDSKRGICVPDEPGHGLNPKDFDSTALKMGTIVELEHTSDWNLAQKIAMDHLHEHPKYYEGLEKLEKELKKK